MVALSEECPVLLAIDSPISCSLVDGASYDRTLDNDPFCNLIFTLPPVGNLSVRRGIRILEVAFQSGNRNSFQLVASYAAGPRAQHELRSQCGECRCFHG